MDVPVLSYERRQLLALPWRIAGVSLVVLAAVIISALLFMPWTVRMGINGRTTTEVGVFGYLLIDDYLGMIRYEWRHGALIGTLLLALFTVLSSALMIRFVWRLRLRAASGFPR